MIYFFQILLVILYVIFMIVTSKNKNKKQSFKKSKKKYQDMVDETNKINLTTEKLNDKSDSSLKDYKNSNKTQSELKMELIKKLNDRKSLLKSNQKKLLSFTQTNTEDIKETVNSSKILDLRSMENAIDHTDDSVYSNSLVLNCEFDHSKDNRTEAYKLAEELQNKFSKEDLRKAIVMKEILDTPVSMR